MKPLRNDMTIEEDQRAALVLLAWIHDLDVKKKRRDRCVPTAVFQKDPLQQEILMCRAQFEQFTTGSILQVFRIENGVLCTK